MPSFTGSIKKIADALKKNKTFFIAGHTKPDGDTVGSSLALGSLLARLGKTVKIYTKEPLPEYLKFLPDTNKIIPADKVKETFDCAIILECKDFERMGNLITKNQAKTIINIDHHRNYNKFGHINYINSNASSSAEQVFNLFRYMKIPLIKEEAKNLYVGLVTDTGKFQQANSTPEAFLMAAYLIQKCGIIPSDIYYRIYATKSVSSLKLLGKCLENLRLDIPKKVAYIEITNKIYKNTLSDVSETEGVINYCMMIPGVKIGILFREEEKPATIKVSFRSDKDIDVNKIAKHFGGGGHKNAAGCTLKGSIKSVEKKVLNQIKKVL